VLPPFGPMCTYIWALCAPPFGPYILPYLGPICTYIWVLCAPPVWGPYIFAFALYAPRLYFFVPPPGTGPRYSPPVSARVYPPVRTPYKLPIRFARPKCSPIYYLCFQTFQIFYAKPNRVINFLVVLVVGEIQIAEPPTVMQATIIESRKVPLSARDFLSVWIHDSLSPGYVSNALLSDVS